jgi:hypothetical protein
MIMYQRDLNRIFGEIVTRSQGSATYRRPCSWPNQAGLPCAKSWSIWGRARGIADLYPGILESLSKRLDDTTPKELGKTPVFWHCFHTSLLLRNGAVAPSGDESSRKTCINRLIVVIRLIQYQSRSTVGIREPRDRDTTTT